MALDKLGTHLKYFSQKQDVILIKNLLSSVQHRWEKIVSRSAERTRHLERGYKEAKQVCGLESLALMFRLTGKKVKQLVKVCWDDRWLFAFVELIQKMEHNFMQPI